MRLAHLHFARPIPYSHSLRLQEAVLERQFAYNTHVLRGSKTDIAKDGSSLAPPAPTLLTFQTDPVYTVGRRHLKSNPLSQAQIDFLTTNSESRISEKREEHTQLATFYPSPRGGLLTYHAPGQLTAYLIINLRAHSITPRCFIRLLENTVIRTCARHGVPNTLTTEDPGVWVGETATTLQASTQTEGEVCGGSASLKATSRKICAVGVHVTRGVTSHGIGLNIRDTAIAMSPISHLYRTPSSNGTVEPASGYLSWGFDRIVACGLEGKSVTWLTKEGADPGLTLDTVANSLAEETCKSLSKQGRIRVTEVRRVNEEEIFNGTTPLTHGEIS